MSFSIHANTFTLVGPHDTDQNVLLTNKKSYVIPVYQRPYSWSEVEIKPFLRDLIEAADLESEAPRPEEIFMGTMQLTQEINGVQEIIDGQQRLTTFLLLLQVLALKFPASSRLQQLPKEWLKTDVNQGEQQAYLEEVYHCSDLLENNAHLLNPYLKNAQLISSILEESVEEHALNHFIDFLFNKVYFVVIETRASLSKTLQIFDSINTAGLDLNAGDIFKLRMFEYLKMKGKEDEVFERISQLYAKIDSNNKKLGSADIDILQILKIYQFYLIGKYRLSADLLSYKVNTFYEHLFDSLLQVNNTEHFTQLNGLELSLGVIDQLIDTRYDWEVKWRNNEFATVEDNGLILLMRYSRYSRLRVLRYVMLQQLANQTDKYDKLARFNRALMKYLIYYSVTRRKSIYAVHTKFTGELLQIMLHQDFDEVMSFINTEHSEQRSEKIESLVRILNGDICENSKEKNIFCRLSALLEEPFHSNNSEDIKSIKKRFLENIDIEHIQSYNDEDSDSRELIKQQWGADLNSIGNLVVLESSLNRSIGNDSKKKLENYLKSEFQIVKEKLCPDYEDWNLPKCQERKAVESAKIIQYLF